ncbi:MAG TPA: hypothetical protein VNJ47_12315 [Nevskiales bacterium]|nr:hypothetical protein [Nevskiales bacterium]
MSDAWLVGILLVVGAAVALMLFRRKPAKAVRPQGTVTQPRGNMLQIVVPPEGCCEAARQLQSHRFDKTYAPALPLENCDRRLQCRCRFQLVADRRIGERRSGHEKRDSIRYEENPRRKGRGRRAQDKLFDHD